MSYRVIILEDNKIDALLMKANLFRSETPFGKIRLVFDKESYVQALQKFQPDLILSDYRLIGFNGLEAINLKNQYCADVPLVIVSGTIGEEKAVELIKAGASDFLIKTNVEARLAQVSLRAIDETREKKKRQIYEKELETQLQLNEQVINSLPGIFFIISKEGEVKRVNQKLKELVNQKTDDPVHFKHFVVPEDVQKASDSLKEAFKKGFIETELSIKSADGRHVPFLMTGVVNLFSTNEYLIGTGIDIEERLRIEKELLREKRFIDQAINSVPGLFYVLDEDQNFIRTNQDFIDSLGYSREEIDRMNPLDFFLKEDHDKVTKAMENAFTRGKSVLVSRVETKSGNLPYYFLTASHFTEDGKNYLLGTGVNITEQIKLEELLNQAQQLSEIGAWEFDPESNELSWTEVLKQIHEVEPDYQPGIEKAINFYKEGDNRNKIIQAVEEAKENGKSYDLELQIETAKGNTRWIRTIGKAEFRNGKCTRLYGSSQNIHEKKIAEENLKKSLKEKEILLMEIHHRVKNNLALVSGFMQLQAFQTENKTVARCLNDSQSRVKSIAIIHEHLYENHSLSEIKLKENIVKLAEHIQNSIEPDKKINLNINSDEINLNINQAIPFALIVNELLTNSYKHAFQGRKSGEIDLVLKKERGKKITLEIRDNGVGLPSGFTLQNQDTLGITILKTLSNQLAGKLSFHSDKKGTKFTLVFKKLNKIKGASSSFVN